MTDQCQEPRPRWRAAVRNAQNGRDDRERPHKKLARLRYLISIACLPSASGNPDLQLWEHESAKRPIH
jgi:hypothetical protein